MGVPQSGLLDSDATWSKVLVRSTHHNKILEGLVIYKSLSSLSYLNTVRPTIVQMSVCEITLHCSFNTTLHIVNKTLGRERNPRANGIWLSKLTV